MVMKPLTFHQREAIVKRNCDECHYCYRLFRVGELECLNEQVRTWWRGPRVQLAYRPLLEDTRKAVSCRQEREVRLLEGLRRVRVCGPLGQKWKAKAPEST